jgi:hypothetical protein
MSPHKSSRRDAAADSALARPNIGHRICKFTLQWQADPGQEPRDPVMFAAIATLLVAVAAGASWLPAQRAAALDPITTLREG